MHSPSPTPASLEVFLDARGDERALRATWHAEAGVVVFSLWRSGFCAGTFRLSITDAPAMIEMLRASLEDAYDGARGSGGEQGSWDPGAWDDGSWDPGAWDEGSWDSTQASAAVLDDTDAFDHGGTFFGGFRGTQDEAG